MSAQYIIEENANSEPIKTTSSNPLGSVNLKKVPANFTQEELNSFTNLWLDYSQIGMTIPYIQSILVNATQGFSQNQAAMFTAVLDKEPLLVAHFQTRKLAVMGLDWSIVGGTEKKQEDIKKILEDSGIGKLQDHLLSSLIYGYAGAAINWGAGGGTIRDFRMIDPINWTFDKKGNVALYTAQGEQIVINDQNATQFVFHYYTPKPGIPSTGGLMRSLIWIYFFKHMAVKHQARFLEKFGIPFLITKISENDFRDDTVRTLIKNQLRDIGADGAGVITDQANVDILNATTQQANFLGWIKYQDDVYAITILGQLASSSAGGGFSKDQIQENVRRDIMESDAKALSETITNQLIRPLEEFKYGTHECKFLIDYKPSEDVSEKVKTIQAVHSLGLNIKPQWIEDTLGIPLETEEGASQVQSPVSAPTQSSSPNSGSATGALLTPPSSSGNIPSGISSAPALPSQASPVPSGGELTPETPAQGLNDSGSKKNLMILDDGWSPIEEAEFRNWYYKYAEENNLNPNPDIDGNGKALRELWNKAPVPDDYLVQGGIEQPPQQVAQEVSQADAETNQAYLDNMVKELDSLAQISAVGKMINATEIQLQSYFESAWNKLPAQVQNSFDKSKLYRQFKNMRLGYLQNPQTTFEQVADAKSFQLAPEERTDWQKTEESFARGYGDFIHSMAGVADMLLGGSNAKIREFNKNFGQYKQAEDKDDAVKGTNFLSDAWYSTVRMAPGVINTIAPALAGGVLSVPIMAGRALAFIPQYLQGAGDIYNSIVSNGVDRDIASVVSLAAAAPYAALGQAQFGKMLGKYAPKFLPYSERLKTGATDAINKAVGKYGADAVEKTLGSVWKNSVLKKGANFSIDVGEQAGQEVLQDILSSMSETGSAYVNDVMRGTNLYETQPDLAERMKQWGDTFVQSIGPMFLMTLGSRFGGKLYTELAKKKTAAQKAYELRPDQFIRKLAIDETPDESVASFPISDLRDSDAFKNFVSTHKNVASAVNSGFLNFEFRNNEEMGGEHRAGSFVMSPDGDKATIYINTDEIKTPEQLTQLLAHEDFVHRFMYGDDSNVSNRRRERIENLIDELSKKDGITWWSKNLESNYADFYSKRAEDIKSQYMEMLKGVKDPDIKKVLEQDVNDIVKRLILQEKVAYFFGKGRGWENIPKKSELGRLISEIVLWLKQKFPKVFGQMSERDVLNTVSDIYSKYLNSEFTAPKQVEDSAKDGEKAALVTVKTPLTFRRWLNMRLANERDATKQERIRLKDADAIKQEGRAFLEAEAEAPKELLDQYQVEADKLQKETKSNEEYEDKLNTLLGAYMERIGQVKQDISKEVIRKSGVFKTPEQFYSIVSDTSIPWDELSPDEQTNYSVIYSYNNRFADSKTKLTKLQKTNITNKMLDSLSKDFEKFRTDNPSESTLYDTMEENISLYLTQSKQAYKNNASGLNQMERALADLRLIEDERARMTKLLDFYVGLSKQLDKWTVDAQGKLAALISKEQEKLVGKKKKASKYPYAEGVDITPEEHMIILLDRFSTISKEEFSNLTLARNMYFQNPKLYPNFDIEKANEVLSRQNIYSMDMEGVSNAISDIQLLSKENSDLYRQRKASAEADLNNLVALSKQDIEAQWGTDLKTPPKSAMLSAKQMFQRAFNMGISPDLIPEWYVGFKEESAFTKTMYSDLVDSLLQKKILDSKWNDMLTPMLKDAGIARHVFREDINIQGENFSITKLMAAYAYSLNKTSLSHLRGTFGDKTDAILSDINKWFEQGNNGRYKDLIHKIISFYDAEVYPATDALYYRLHGIHLPKEANYFPINSLELLTNSRQTTFDVLSKSFKQIGIRRPTDYFTMERATNSPIPFDSLDFFRTMSINLKDVGNFVTMFESVDKARGLLNSDLKDTLKTVNPVWYEKLVDQINGFANNKPAKDRWTVASDVLRANFGAAVLGFNLSPVLVQPAAILPGLVNVFMRHPTAVLSAVKEMSGMSIETDSTNLSLVLNNIYDKSDFMRTRSTRTGQSLMHWINTAFSKELEGLGLARTVHEDLQQWSFIMLQSSDNICSCYVWNANYKSALLDGKTEAEAIKVADEVVRKTQQINDPELMPSLFTQPLTKIFAQFQLPVTQIVNGVIRDWTRAGMTIKREGWSSEQSQKAMKTAAFQTCAGLIGTAMITYLIKNGFQEFFDNNEDAKKKALKLGIGTTSEMFQMLASPIMIFGPTLADQVQAGADMIRRNVLAEPVQVRKVDPVTPPVLSMMGQLAEGAFKSVSDIAKYGFKGAWERGELGNYDMYRGVMGAAGLPVIAFGKVARQWDKFEKYGDPRYLIYGASKIDVAHPISSGLYYPVNEYDKKMEEQGLAFRILPPNKVVSQKVTDNLETWFVLDDEDYRAYWELSTSYFTQMYPSSTPVFKQNELGRAWTTAKSRAREVYNDKWRAKYSDSFMEHIQRKDNMKSFADELTQAQLMEKGNELIRMLKAITNGKTQASALKEEITPYVMNAPLETPEGTIVYVEGSEGQVLNRSLIRNMLVEQFKIEPAKAEALLNGASSKKFIEAYLKVLAKKAPVAPKQTAPDTQAKEPEKETQVKNV